MSLSSLKQKLKATVATPTNTLVTIINDVIDTLVKGLGEKAAIAEATAYAPWLAWPIISTAFSMFVGWLGSTIATNLDENADILIIRLENTSEETAYNNAISTLNTVMNDPTSTADQQAAAIAAAKSTLENLVNMNKT